MPLVAPLVELAGVWVAIGLICLAIVLVAALFQTAEATIGWVPWLGGKAKAKLIDIEKRLNSRLSEWLEGMQGIATASWHMLAQGFEDAGDAIWRATQLAAHVEWQVATVVPRLITREVGRLAPAATTRIVKPITQNVTKLTKVNGISVKQWRDLLKRVTALGAAVAVLRHAHAPPIDLPRYPPLTLPKWVRGLRGRVGRLERNFKPLVFTALVTGVLAKLGMLHLKRPCVKRNNDLLCKTDFGALEALLGAATIAIGFNSVVRFAQGMQDAEEEMVGVLEKMVIELGELR